MENKQPKRTVRTTTREFKTAVRQYIFENADEEYMQEGGFDEKSVGDAFRCIYEAFLKEYYRGQERRFQSRHQAFEEWLRGVPGAMATEIYYDDQRKTVQKWLAETDAQTAARSDNEIADKYYHYITREVLAVIDELDKGEKETSKLAEIRAKGESEKTEVRETGYQIEER